MIVHKIKTEQLFRFDRVHVDYKCFFIASLTVSLETGPLNQFKLYVHFQIAKDPTCPLAASNILVKRRCNCTDIFSCVCPESGKCLVKLADFDSVKSFESRVFARLCQEWRPYVPMTEEECAKVMGTPGYRAPEVRRCNGSCM